VEVVKSEVVMNEALGVVVGVATGVGSILGAEDVAVDDDTRPSLSMSVMVAPRLGWRQGETLRLTQG
jgi:hypothetical protein